MLHETLPDGFAVQGEVVGPNIQSNPMGLAGLEFKAFNVYSIVERRYLDYDVFSLFCDCWSIPMVRLLSGNVSVAAFSDQALQTLAEGTYPNGKQREGIVIRPMQEKRVKGERVSVKVINLLYRD